MVCRAGFGMLFCFGKVGQERRAWVLGLEMEVLFLFWFVCLFGGWFCGLVLVFFFFLKIIIIITF